MGNKNIKSTKEKLLLRKDQFNRRVDKKLQFIHSEWVMISGPPQGGKTVLFDTLLDQMQQKIENLPDCETVDRDILINDATYFNPYEKTDQIKIGLKLFDTLDDKFLYPLSLKLLDTPGALMESQAMMQYAFNRSTQILLVFDFSKLLNRQQIIDWTKFTMEQVQSFHPYFNEETVPEQQSSYLQDHSHQNLYNDDLRMKSIVFDDDNTNKKSLMNQ